MPYHPEIHHRRSLRLQNYDYSQHGLYFVTICAYNRECLFGEIVENQMHLNEYGLIVQEGWNKILEHFPQIDLDVSIVMPNHLHGIVVLNTSGSKEAYPKLGQVIGYFKYQLTKQINTKRKTTGIPVWQRSYYEHIIRSEKALDKIREYIVNNLIHWAIDRENPINNRSHQGLHNF